MATPTMSVVWHWRPGTGDSDGFDFRVADKGFVRSYPGAQTRVPRVTAPTQLHVGDESEKKFVARRAGLSSPRRPMTGLPLVCARWPR
jgi:hypothetical protein